MKIILYGADGRVGSKVKTIALQRKHEVIPLDRKTPAPPLPDDEKFWSDAVVVDFSAPDATEEICALCRKHRCPLVTGVTGRNEQQQNALNELSRELPVIAESNFSEGIAALNDLVRTIAEKLADWDCEIVEIHRKGKKDSPSGTAKMLAATAARGKSFKSVTVHALRCGTNSGCHSVIFASQGESLTLTHQAENTDIFALGAIKAAEKLLDSVINAGV